MTRPPAYHFWKFLMKNMIQTNSGLTRYNCLCFISIFAWVVLKKATFCGNNCENVGIILRIIGEFKKNFWKE